MEEKQNKPDLTIKILKRGYLIMPYMSMGQGYETKEMEFYATKEEVLEAIKAKI